MTTPSLFVNLGLLKHNRNFRNVFVARTVSLLGLGMLAVAIPLQVYELTSDTLAVGMAMAIEGAGMFIGLLLGGVLADLYDRRRLILFARAVCGLGFVGLAANAWLPAPSLWAVYVLSAWDGFFGALGVTALMACMPHVVGRENLMQARAISMVTVRLVTVLSPALGGIIIAAAGVGWTYLAAAIGTGLTLLPLLQLPSMRPAATEPEHPLRALAGGLRFMLGNKVVASAVLVGTIVSLMTTVRVLFPALAESAYGGGPRVLGMMYSAVPLGATIGAIVSGWTSNLRRPGLWLMLTSLGAFLCITSLGFSQHIALALVLLAAFGYFVSIASLLQYALVQGHTPDHYLGRVNGLWSAQDAAGDSFGAVGIGAAGKVMSSLASIATVGAAGVVLGVAMLCGFASLRRAPLHDAAI